MSPVPARRGRDRKRVTDHCAARVYFAFSPAAVMTLPQVAISARR